MKKLLFFLLAHKQTVSLKKYWESGNSKLPPIKLIYILPGFHSISKAQKSLNQRVIWHLEIISLEVFSQNNVLKEQVISFRARWYQIYVCNLQTTEKIILVKNSLQKSCLEIHRAKKIVFSKILCKLRT